MGRDFKLCDHVAIVTGSAQGFGKEFVRLLLKNGAKVCVSDVNVEEGKKTLREFGEAFGHDNVTFHR